MIRLVAFDGDHTLWEPLSGVCVSDSTHTDGVGSPDFTFTTDKDNPLIAVRDDGALFALRPEARAVFEALRGRGVSVGVVSYNHLAPIESILEALELSSLVDYVVAEYHSRKDEMLGKMLAEIEGDGRVVETGEVLLVDDDPEGKYRGQCERMGTGFVKFGVDIGDLWGVLLLAEEANR